MSNENGVIAPCRKAFRQYVLSPGRHKKALTPSEGSVILKNARHDRVKDNRFHRSRKGHNKGIDAGVINTLNLSCNSRESNVDQLYISLSPKSLLNMPLAESGAAKCLPTRPTDIGWNLPPTLDLNSLVT